MKKLVLLFMFVWGTVYAQQDQLSEREEFLNIVTVEEAEKYYNELVAKTPENAANKELYDQLRGQLAVDWLSNGNVEKYSYYKSTKPTFTALQLFELSNTLEKWIEEVSHVKLVEQISSELLGELQQERYEDRFDRKGVLLEVNGVANARLGNLKLAHERMDASNEKAMFRSFPYFRNSKANYLNRLAVIISADGEHQRALDTLSKAIREGNSTPAMRMTFKDVYQKVKGGTEGADQALSALQNEAYEKIYAEVQKDWQAEGRPVPAVRLTDYNRKSVDLSTFRGGVTVIDFWSTACKPCVAAFPAFERVVQEYQDQPFDLFVINIGEEPAMVKNYMVKNGYTLDVLFDHDEAIFNALEALGTPQKFIIDPKGNIHLTGIGYAGSDDKEYYKLKAMIELTKYYSNNS